MKKLLLYLLGKLWETFGLHFSTISGHTVRESKNGVKVVYIFARNDDDDESSTFSKC